MRVIQEKLDKEIFIDIIVSSADLQEIIKGEMVSVEFRLGKDSVSLGVRKPIPGENDATQKGEIKKSNK